MPPKTKKAAPARPTYSVMVNEALKTLADRTGSSLPAIRKQLLVLYSGLEVNKVALSSALKKGVDSGDLVKVKASYKIAKKEPPTETKPKAKKPAAKKSTTTTKPKKTGPKKTITKKSSAKPKAKAKTKKVAATTKVVKPTPRKPPAKRGTRTSARTRK